METVAGQKIYVVSLGCPKNLVDTQLMAGNLLDNQAVWVDTPDEADIYLINTCAFLPEARDEAFDEIEEALDWKQPDPENRVIVVSGCLCQYGADEDLKLTYPEVDFWAGIDDVNRLDQILTHRKEISRSREFIHSAADVQLQLTLPHTAYLKISDGCNNNCTYCAIPRLRGKLRSRKIEDVLTEARQLVDNGVKELVIIAQDSTSFGQDNGESLAQLLLALDEIEGNFQTRLLYTHPAHYTDELFEAFAKCRKLMHYVDIPLQHISDRILKAMNRHIDRSGIESVLNKIREVWSDAVIRTTFIVGFPGESQAEFDELKEFVQKYRFERFGVFCYSAEDRTAAAAMPDQIPETISLSRQDELMTLQNLILREFNRQQIGKKVKVIIDGELEDDVSVARSYMDAPDIDTELFVCGSFEPGTELEVEIIRSEQDVLYAREV